MNQLIDRVGLSANVIEKSTNLLLSNIESQHGKLPAATPAEILKRRRATEAPKLLGLIANESADGDTTAPDLNNLDSVQVPSANMADHHLRVLQRINVDKQSRKKREGERRQKTLQKYA